MTTIISVLGTKGGVGTSVFTAALAIAAADRDTTVLVCGDPDMPAIFGMAHDPEYVADAGGGVSVMTAHLANDVAPPSMFDLVLSADDRPDADHRLLVTNACYLALRRALTGGTPEPTGIVLVEEPYRSLGRGDVEDVLGAPVVATVQRHPDIARQVDAGVLPRRVHTLLLRPAQEVLDRIGLRVAS